MAIIVCIPTQLRSLTEGAREVSVDGSTVGQVLANLEAAHPGFSASLFDDSDQLHRFINLFLGDEEVRFLGGLDTAVADGQTLTIMPAVAGG